MVYTSFATATVLAPDRFWSDKTIPLSVDATSVSVPVNVSLLFLSPAGREGYYSGRPL